MVIFQALAASGAFFRVDNVDVFTLGYRASRANIRAAAALYTVLGDFVSHAKFPLKRKDARGQFRQFHHQTGDNAQQQDAQTADS